MTTNKPALIIRHSSMSLKDGKWRVLISVELINFSAQKIKLSIQSRQEEEEKDVQNNKAEFSLIDIPQETRNVKVTAEAVDNVGKKITKNYFVNFPEVGTSEKEDSYTDEITFKGLGENGQYRIICSITDQNSNPIGKGLQFCIIDKFSGKYLKKEAGGWIFSDVKKILEFNENGNLDEDPFVEIEKNTTLQFIPQGFAFKQKKGAKIKEVPHIDLDGKKITKEWFEDNNFYGYCLFIITLIVFLICILFPYSVEDWVWELSNFLNWASFFYLPYMFSDEIWEAFKKCIEVFKSKSSEYYQNFEDRPKEGVGEQIKNVAKQSALDWLGSGIIVFLNALFIEGLGHKLFGKRR